MSFSEKLQNLRKEKKYSQEHLADLLDVTRQSVSKWESGQTYPEMDKLLAICKIFNCTLDELTNDEIKEISSEKKTGLNLIVDSVLDLVTKSYKMITSMSFKELIRCTLLMLIVVFILSLFNHPLNYLQYSLYNVFLSFGSLKVAAILSTNIDFLLDIIYVIVSGLIFIHIFKIGFLDKYEFIPKQVNKEEEKNIKEPKEEKIIREAREPNYAFYDTLSKIIMFFIKIILILFLLPFIVLLIVLFGLLAVDLYLIFTGVLYFSIPILIIFSILLNILIIEFVFNILFNKKNNFKRMLLMFIISIAGIGLGSGLFVLDASRTKIIDGMPKEIKKINNVYEYTYEEGMFFDYWKDINYIVDNELNNKININITTYKGFNNISFSREDKGYYINNFYGSPESIPNLIDIIIKGLRNNRVYNINTYDATLMSITASEKTINNLKNNLQTFKDNQKYQNDQFDYYENQISELYDIIDDLQDEINSLTEENYDLANELQEYKNRIKSVIE